MKGGQRLHRRAAVAAPNGLSLSHGAPSTPGWFRHGGGAGILCGAHQRCDMTVPCVPAPALLTARAFVSCTTASHGAAAAERTVDSTVAAVGDESSRRCLLCDTSFDAWATHRRTPAHIARSAICHAFVMPERSSSIMHQLAAHINLDFEAVDEVTAEKEKRRQSRLSSTFVHLADEGVLFHSLPFLPSSAGEDEDAEAASVASSSPSSAPQPPLQVSEDKFLNFALNGEAYARRELLDRTARLMPTTGADELDAIVTFVLSPRNVSRLYDELNLAETVTHRKPSRGSSLPSAAPVEATTGAVAKDEEEEPAQRVAKIRRQEEKALVFFSCLGELAHLQRQDRSHSVADRAAADVLVQHVLATHATENAISELVHGVLQRVVNDGSPVWARHLAEVRQRAASPAAVQQEAEAKHAASSAPGAPQPPLSSSRLSDFTSLSQRRGQQQAPPRSAAVTTEGAAMLQDQLKAFLPIERIGTGSSAPGSKKERLIPALGVTTSAASAHSAEQSAQRRQVGHWAATLQELRATTGPPFPAEHPTATYAAVTPRMTSRKPIR